MINEKKVLGTLGLAMKAGHIVSGKFMTEKAVRDRRAELVMVAADASANTKKSFRIPVGSIMCPMRNLAAGTSWEMPSERSSGHHWRLRIKGLPH